MGARPAARRRHRREDRRARPGRYPRQPARARGSRRYGPTCGRIAMLRQLLVGGAVSVGNIVIHALVMAAVVRVAQTVGAKSTWGPSRLLIAVMIATISVLMAAHVAE